MITVCIRKRPLLNKESQDIIAVNANDLIINKIYKAVDNSEKVKQYRYKYDYVFSDYDNNQYIFDTLLFSRLQTIRSNPVNQLLFCVYGETGSGKTYTMIDNNGILQLTLQYLLNKYTIYVTAYEIYNNDVYDLLDYKHSKYIKNIPKFIKIQGLKSYIIESINDIDYYVNIIKQNRITGETSKNSRSSRSHLVIELYLSNLQNTRNLYKIRFVDLAGNERTKDSLAKNRGDRREVAEINKSLFSFKECIRALYNNSKYIPFRRSCLTQVLKEHFIYQSDMIIIGNISPSVESVHSTMNTLNYISMLLEIDSKQLNYHKKNIEFPMKKQSPELTKTKRDVSYYEDKLGNSNIKINKIDSPKLQKSPPLTKINMNDILHPKLVKTIFTDSRTELAMETMIDVFSCYISRKKNLCYELREILSKIKKNKKNKKLWDQSYDLIHKEFMNTKKFRSLFVNSVGVFIDDFEPYKPYSR